jgi:hypothetical protein
MESAMTDEARIIALTAEAEAARAEADRATAEADRVRVENEALRRAQVEARHHIALALGHLNGAGDGITRRHEHG